MAQEMTEASKVWPYLTPWTVGEVKTAAWLVDNNHLTQLERVFFTSDLDTSSVSSQLDIINTKINGNISTKNYDEIFHKKGV